MPVVGSTVVAGGGARGKVRTFAPAGSVPEDRSIGSAVGSLACRLARRGRIARDSASAPSPGAETGYPSSPCARADGTPRGSTASSTSATRPVMTVARTTPRCSVGEGRRTPSTSVLPTRRGVSAIAAHAVQPSTMSVPAALKNEDPLLPINQLDGSDAPRRHLSRGDWRPTLIAAVLAGGAVAVLILAFASVSPFERAVVLESLTGTVYWIAAAFIGACGTIAALMLTTVSLMEHLDTRRMGPRFLFHLRLTVIAAIATIALSVAALLLTTFPLAGGVDVQPPRWQVDSVFFGLQGLTALMVGSFAVVLSSLYATIADIFANLPQSWVEEIMAEEEEEEREEEAAERAEHAAADAEQEADRAEGAATRAEDVVGIGGRATNGRPEGGAR